MNLVTLAYGCAAGAYLLLSLALVAAKRIAWPFSYLLLMAVLFAIWAAIMVAGVYQAISPEWLLMSDGLHAFGALLFLGQLIGRGASGSWRTAFAWGPWLVPVICVVFVVQGVNAYSVETAIFLSVGFALAGLLAAEQVYRNAGVMKRKVASLVALAFGAIFVFDLFVFSNALIGQAINAEFWAARGFVNALAVPILLLALKRDPDWQSGFFVSRQVVFYSTSLIGVGMYLMLVAFGGALVQSLGGEWGTTLKITFIVASVILLALILFSRGVRRRLKVFLATHFYANRYDYREEWLKLINRLAQDSNRAPMPVLCLEGLADILDSDGGTLWLHEKEHACYKTSASFGEFDVDQQLDINHPLVAFISKTGWVVDGRQANEDPEHYRGELLSCTDLVSADALFIPLMLDDQLLGIARLNRPVGMPALNFEDHDLLRTVGRQLAVFVAQSRSEQQLTQARQFDVFNRFSAFVMHDLKNLIAQQSLVVENAKKFKTNPAFVEDAIGTIDNSVKRMSRLLEQLQSGQSESPVRRIQLAECVAAAVDDCNAHSPQPELSIEADATLMANPERLQAVFVHLIRNAQDATNAETGTVAVTIACDHEEAVVTIADSGCGMTKSFIADQMFSPFVSTKGAKGMGVGAFQAKDYVEGLGGSLAVDSTVNVGTTIRVALPLA